MSDRLPILSSSFASLPVPGYNQGVSSPYSRTANELMRGLSYDLSQDVADAGGRVAQALLAPVRAAKGEYDQVSIYPNGYVSPIDERLISDAADFSGLVSVGSMPIARPRNSLGMGGKVSDYGMEHRPPNPRDGYGAYLHDASGMYGDDIYSANALDYFGTGNPKMDRESLAAISHARNNPSAPVTIYRAIPSSIDASINPGDWVTTSKEYARIHGDSVLGGDYKVVKQTVPARQLTNGGDIHEWGWWPE